MSETTKSDILSAIHETATDLHKAGLIKDEAMRDIAAVTHAAPMSRTNVEDDGRLPAAQGRAGGADAPEPSGLGPDERSSLTQRLRQEAADWVCGPVVLEAADEIERLRETLRDAHREFIYLRELNADDNLMSGDFEGILHRINDALLALRVSDGNRDGEDAQRLRPEGMTARCHAVADARLSSSKARIETLEARLSEMETALKEIEALPSFRMDEASMIARSALRSKGETDV